MFAQLLKVIIFLIGIASPAIAEAQDNHLGVELEGALSGCVTIPDEHGFPTVSEVCQNKLIALVTGFKPDGADILKVYVEPVTEADRNKFYPTYDAHFSIDLRTQAHPNVKDVCIRQSLSYHGHLEGHNIILENVILSEEMGWVITTCEALEHWIDVGRGIPTLPFREDLIVSFPKDMRSAVLEVCEISPTDADSLTAESLTDQLIGLKRHHNHFPDWSDYSMLFALSTGFYLNILFDLDERGERLRIKHCDVSPPVRY